MQHAPAAPRAVARQWALATRRLYKSTTTRTRTPEDSIAIASPVPQLAVAAAPRASGMEEFQEADVLWPDAHHHDYCHRHHNHHADQQHHATAGRLVRPPHSSSSSVPVRIPEMARAGPKTSRQPSWALSHHHNYDDDDGAVFVRRASASEAAAIVPPHVLAARRCAAERRVVSSVCVGHGRTLKGRDLCAVRNAVLHMTGFLGSSDKY